jgi:hypothetical protein
MRKKLLAWLGVGISALILASACGCGSDSGGMSDKDIADLKAHDAHAAKPPTAEQMKSAARFRSSLMDHPSGGDPPARPNGPASGAPGMPGGG